MLLFYFLFFVSYEREMFLSDRTSSQSSSLWSSRQARTVECEKCTCHRILSIILEL